MALYTVRVSLEGLSSSEAKSIDRTLCGFGAMNGRSVYSPPFSIKEPPSAKHYTLPIDSEESAADLEDRILAAIAETLNKSVGLAVRRHDEETGLETVSREEMQQSLMSGDGFPSIYELSYEDIAWIATWLGDDGRPGGHFYNHIIIDHYTLNVGEDQNTWAKLGEMMRARKRGLEMTE